MSPDQVIAHLKKHVLFQGCTDAFLNDLAEKAVLQRLSKGQVLFLQHDEVKRFFLVLKGWVKLYRETLDGAQAIVDVVPSGQMFGEAPLFLDHTSSFGAEATDVGEVISLPLQPLEAELKKNPAFALEVLKHMAQRQQNQERELEHRDLQTAPQRIGCFILRLAKQDAEGSVTLHLPYDKNLVAQRLGMQPETFSRALSKLKKATNMEVKGSTIKLESLQTLAEFCCAGCSSTFPCGDLTSK